MLSRLPARPPDILASLSPADFDTSTLDDYLVQQSTTLDDTSTSYWNHLQVVASVNTLILRITLGGIAWALYRNGRPGSIFFGTKLVNVHAGLLRLAFQLSAKPIVADEERSWVIVKAFLWTSWQRALMLDLWCRLREQLRQGFSYDWNTNILGPASIPEISTQLNLQESEDKKNLPYMCSWAYELLRNDRASLTTDLRHFHWSYRNLFGNRPARCNDSQRQCKGGSPQICQRFKGAMVKNQSAHDSDRCDEDCRNGHRRLLWDRESFINTSGAKAVCFTATDNKNIRYRTASDKTLAISHVWSHGQGGRPDERQGDEGRGPINEPIGFNTCLHHRYMKLALDFHCDSYWMDTPCIPHEKILRTECINNINKIFTQSRVTLVCDRDIMSIDITDLTMDLRESILATVLICDWNIRAWTLLEAMRGRNNIYLLCAGNKVLSFKETLEAVCENGRVDLATLLLSTQHLLPAEPIDDHDLFGTKLTTEEGRMMQLGYVSLGEASILLSHRHATRDGDDVVIWSLLTHERAIKDVMQLWKSQIDSKINTGFLMSSTPRIQGRKGWSWAPSCPTLQPPSSFQSNEKVYLAYDGTNSQIGLITPEGLQAKWLVYEFLLSSAEKDTGFPRNVMIARQYLSSHRFGALLRPGQLPGPRLVPAPYQGKVKTPLIAICGSNDGRCWEWRGVFEWETSDPMPNMELFPQKPGAPPNAFLLKDILLV